MQDLAPGAGEAAKTGDKVAVHYVGTLTDGKEFDASKKHGDKPFEFELGAGRVIKGWDDGVVGMKVGGKRKLTIPPSLGYGARGAGSAIPPNATLVFEVEMVKITPAGAP
ncbi:MAG: FKBP-type peptidyl-prolyl cis-trans isomerase [Labilithrix sp.]|nr:FKBP-type peptidyl-prolyl cis-trans isomerase [Labilithrix sp.]MCW5813141.1 FKBP-type peptidyl-prolyl cis-trans isomerase [Labilithrix sp.]